MLYIIREQAKGENNQHLCLVLTLKLNSISEANMKKSNNESSLDLTNVEQTETLISLLNELTVELKTDKLPKRYYRRVG